MKYFLKKRRNENSLLAEQARRRIDIDRPFRNKDFLKTFLTYFFFFFKEEKWGENFFNNPQRESEEVKIDRCDSSRTLNCHSVA